MNQLRNRTLLAICASVGMSFIGIGMVVPVRVLYAQSQGASLAVIGAMASAFLLSSFIFQYPVGWLADMWGKRRVMLAGLLGSCVLNLLYLTVSDPVAFVGLRFLEGIFSAGVVSSARAILADDIPDEQRGQAYGIYGAFMNAGFLLGPALGGILATSGYTLAFIASSAFRFLALILVILLVPEGKRARHEERARAVVVPRRAMWTLPLIGAYILFFGDSLYFGFDLTLNAIWLKHHLGATVALIGIGYALWALPNVVLTPFGGRLADRVRRSNLILIFGALQVPCYALFGLANAIWFVFIMFAIHGAVYAMMQPAVDANLAAFSPAEARARVQGLYTAIGMMSSFITANTLGILYAVNFRLPLFAMAGGFGVCLLIGGTMVRVAEGRQTPSAPVMQGAKGAAAE